MPQFLPVWPGNHIDNPHSSTALGEKGCSGQMGHAGFSLPAALSPRVAACGLALSWVSVAGLSTVLWVQGEMVFFMTSGESEKGQKHFFFTVYLTMLGRMAKWLWILYFFGGLSLRTSETALNFVWCLNGSGRDCWDSVYHSSDTEQLLSFWIFVTLLI